MASALREAAWSVLRRVPAPVEERLLAWSRRERFRRAPVLIAPDAEVRLLIGPANYAGQAYQWARAAERELPGVAARNLAQASVTFNFPADLVVPSEDFVRSRVWQQAQLEATRRFSHVMFEAERPLFTRLNDGDVYRQALALRQAGVRVAMMSHGSDVRDPEAHAARHEWSPFNDPDMAEVDRLRTFSQANTALLARLADAGVPTFVSTPDLLVDVPSGVWCPVVVDVDGWACDSPVMQREVPRVVHVPSHRVIKGSDMVESAMGRLADAGVIEFESATGVAHDRMRDLYQGADIVVDQLRIGNYGVATCEALAAGRVVVSHVDDQVRGHVRETTGLELPVVEADPTTLEQVVASLVADRDEAQRSAQSGPRFVRAVHDGARSARTLHTFLRGSGEDRMEV